MDQVLLDLSGKMHITSWSKGGDGPMTLSCPSEQGLGGVRAILKWACPLFCDKEIEVCDLQEQRYFVSFKLVAH